MTRVLVTGGSGFIGRHSIKHLLESGFEVHAVYNRIRRSGELMQAPKLVWHEVNLLDRAGTDSLLAHLKATHLLHFAWYAEPNKFWDSPQNLEWLQASSALLKSFAKNGGKRFVGAGTCAEYDWSQGKLSESATPINPQSLYGSCKSNFQKYAETFCKENNLSFAWGRIFWLYGPGEDARRLIPYVINNLLSGEEAACTEGNQMRDYMYVDDVARAFALLLASNKEGALNIGSGQAVKVSDLINHVGKLLDRKDYINLGARPTPPNEAPLVVAEISRLYHELNFRSQYNLDTGIRETIDWWQKKLF